MNANAIDTYLQTVLAPQLAAFGANSHVSERVTSDVGHRLTSLVCRWNDLAFRRTVLLTGVEEATFYEPRTAPLDVRALVVLGVRNSLIEDLASTDAAASSLGLAHQIIPDRAMPAVTSEAIRYFSGLDLPAIARDSAVPPAEDDIFGHLPADYPIAWQALAHLGAVSTRQADYVPVESAGPHLALPTDQSQSEQDQHVVMVALSGMDPAFDPALQRILQAIATGESQLFFSESFKAITRRPEKLYRLLEFVLAHQAAVVTLNYFLSNGFVARREYLLRPPHMAGEGLEALHQRTGMARRHREALQLIADQMA